MDGPALNRKISWVKKLEPVQVQCCLHPCVMTRSATIKSTVTYKKRIDTFLVASSQYPCGVEKTRNSRGRAFRLRQHLWVPSRPGLHSSSLAFCLQCQPVSPFLHDLCKGIEMPPIVDRPRRPNLALKPGRTSSAVLPGSKKILHKKKGACTWDPLTRLTSLFEYVPVQ
jgi:hypothetical protein